VNRLEKKFSDMTFSGHSFHAEKQFLKVYPCPEVEFLDISFTKNSTLLLNDVQSRFYWRIFKKTILFSGFKNPNKKSAKQENSTLFMNSIL
jgi:hypothetical protein